MDSRMSEQSEDPPQAGRMLIAEGHPAAVFGTSRRFSTCASLHDNGLRPRADLATWT